MKGNPRHSNNPLKCNCLSAYHTLEFMNVGEYHDPVPETTQNLVLNHLVRHMNGLLILATWFTGIMAPEKFDGKKLVLSEEEWRSRLTPQQYGVLRGDGTEQAFSGEYYYLKDDGIYHCAGCGLPLFKSEAKYESGTGWPSFWQPIYPENVTYWEDTSHGMSRVEVRCSRCDSHLGHIFDDGPPPTGKRFCMNSIVLKFKPT